MEISISPINTKQNTSFKQIALIQVPKTAFSHPENMKECSEIFTKKLDAATGDKRFGLSGIFTRQKTVSILENMSYYMAKSSMTANGPNYSVEWAAQNTGLPIKKAIDENFHSFIVFTKEHINIVKKAMAEFRNLTKYAEEAKSKYPSNPNMAILYLMTKYGVDADKILDLDGANAPTERIKLNNLDELSSVTDKLDMQSFRIKPTKT